MELRYEHQKLGPKAECAYQTLGAQQKSKREEKEGRDPQLTPAWQAPGFPPTSQVQLGPCGDRNLQYLGAVPDAHYTEHTY